MKYKIKEGVTRELINRLAPNNDDIPFVPDEVVTVTRGIPFNDYIVRVRLVASDDYCIPMFFSPTSFTKIFEEVKINV